MASRFGAIPLEETPTTTPSRFGATAVEEQPQPQPTEGLSRPQALPYASPTGEVKQPEEKGVADYLNALWEGFKGGASMGVQAAAVPVSGMAGLAKTITSGPEAGAKTIEEIQQATAGLIPAEKAQEAYGQVVEKGLEVPGVRPVVETAMKVPETIGDLSYEGALKLGLSPETATYFGAVGKSALPAAIEILGVKGTSTAKKGLLKNIIKKAEKADFYDEFGALKPEMKTALKDAGIGIDEVADVLPENMVNQKTAQPIAETMKAAKKPEGRVKFGRMEQLAETFDPDIEKIKAFEEMKIDYLPQYVSKNPTARAIAENLKDVSGSLMGDKEKRIIEQTAKAADDIIIEGGGTIEKGELATRYINKSKEVIDNIYAQEKPLYKKVDQFIPGETPISTDNIVGKLQELAKKVGGEKNLTPQQDRLLKMLNKEEGPVYGLLDRERKTIGKQLAGKDTVFRDEDRKILGQIYDAMTADQEAAILTNGNKELLDIYKSAKSLTVQRKNIEKMMKDTIGKKMAGDITKKMGPAIKGLALGDTLTFDNLLKNIPTELGPEMRQDLVTSALNDAFLTGASNKDKLSIGGFGGYWKKLNRQPKAMNRLKENLTPETWKKLNALATVNDALKETMELSKQTGRILSTAGLFEEVNKIGARAYGLVESGVKRVPGGKTVLGLSDYANMPRNARTMAADELLMDRRFLNLLKQKALGKVTTPKQTANIEKMIKRLKTYQKWKKTLPEGDLADLATVGTLGYFTGRQKEEPQR